MNFKSSLILASMALAIVACDDSKSTTTASANGTQKRTKLAPTPMTAQQKAAVEKAAEAKAAAPAQTSVLIDNVIFDEYITNLKNDPYQSMDAISTNTIENHSRRLTYVANGLEHALARLAVKDADGDDDTVWVVLVKKNFHMYMLPTQDEFSAMWTALEADKSVYSEEFSSSLKRRDLQTWNTESYAQASTVAKSVWHTSAKSYAQSTQDVRVYELARVRGFHSGGDTLDMTTSNGFQFASNDGNAYVIVSIETPEVIDPIFGFDYNKSVWTVARVVPNLFRFEYAPVENTGRLFDELNAAAADANAQNHARAEEFIAALKVRGIELNAAPAIQTIGAENASAPNFLDQCVVTKTVAAQ